MAPCFHANEKFRKIISLEFGASVDCISFLFVETQIDFQIGSFANIPLANVFVNKKSKMNAQKLVWKKSMPALIKNKRNNSYRGV